MKECLTPAQPKNLTIMEIPSLDADAGETDLYDIQLDWLKPSLIPDHYIAELLIFNTMYQVTYTTNMTISGESNTAIFKKIKMGGSYQVYLQAISPGGESIRATDHRFVVAPDGLPSYKKNNSEILTTPVVTRPFKYYKTVNILVGMLSILLVFGLSLCIILYTRHKLHNSKEMNLHEKEIEEKQNLNSTFSKIAKTDKWEIPIETLSIQSILGEGNFGIVWRGLIGETPVACKILKDNCTIDEMRQLKQEIELMKNVGSHPNIVSMVGCITQGVTNGPVLIVEYCSKGDLLTYLRAIYDHTSKMLNEYHEDIYHEGRQLFINKSYELNINQTESLLNLGHKDVLSFGSQIAFGMEYLSSQKILHRDLAARNILMCEDKRLKVSDFGLSRDVYMNSVYYKTSGGKLPLRWMALESLTHQIYSSQSDVWSFGVLLWEIVSFGGIPYPGIEAENLTKMLNRGYRMTKPQFCRDEVYAIMTDCWKELPNDRPTFSTLKETFDLLLSKETDYLELASAI